MQSLIMYPRSENALTKLFEILSILLLISIPLIIGYIISLRLERDFISGLSKLKIKIISVIEGVTAPVLTVLLFSQIGVLEKYMQTYIALALLMVIGTSIPYIILGFQKLIISCTSKGK